MRTEWYGDKRDLVKWGALIHLCKEHGISTIVQVPFLTESDKPRSLSIDGKDVTFPEEVWAHFRDLNHAKRIGEGTGLAIEILKTPYSHKQRPEHCEKVCRELNAINGPKVVLLDPDTGLEPGKANGKHVKASEIKDIWETLNKGDCLVLYQHSSREKDWQGAPATKFAVACGVGKVQTIESKGIAHDVAFFAALK